MMLNYVALVLLIIIIALVVYGVVAVWSIPYEIAKKRDHPHQDAILAATWVSLFTLGILWPFLWIWALLYQPHRGPDADGRGDLAQLSARVSALEQRVK